MAESKDETPPLPAAFRGDGKYIGDGGYTLQKLWELWVWSEIKNCPGRYVTKKNIVSQGMTPEQVLDCLHLSGSPQTFDVENNRDKISVVWFFDGGGLITYLKGEGQYVHTFNTESGFQRKTKALGISTDVVVKVDAAVIDSFDNN
jgi:hypothetical protein